MDKSEHSIIAPGYEKRDVRAVMVLGFLAGLSILLFLVLGLSAVLFRYFSIYDVQSGPRSAFSNVRQVPPPPDLQANPRADLLKLTEEQKEKLETYGWQDRSTGTVHVPIERAMDLLLAKGLPGAPTLRTGTQAGTSRQQRTGITANSPKAVGQGTGATR